jgi:adenylate cyclase
VLISVLALGVDHLVRAVRQRRRLARLFEEYVPPQVAKALIDSGRAGQAEDGERLHVTVLFCDLRGFTPLSERLAPSQVRQLLAVYYELLSQIVFVHDGTILQYTGDEIFAVFGAPAPRDDHADAALACARQMISSREALNRQLDGDGLPPLSYGIGLHSGPVVAAHIGSTIRRQYSIVGDTVNVGSRYCSMARDNEVAFSENTLALLAAAPSDAEPLGAVALKGISEPVESYLIRDRTTPLPR